MGGRRLTSSVEEQQPENNESEMSDESRRRRINNRTHWRTNARMEMMTRRRRPARGTRHLLKGEWEGWIYAEDLSEALCRLVLSGFCVQGVVFRFVRHSH